MSRVLDDVEELVFPAALAVGGLWLLYWVTTRTERTVEYVPDAISALADYNVPIVGEGDFIDRWTLNPREVKYELGRLKKWTGRFL